MSDQAVNVHCNTSATPEPPVYLSAWTHNKCCNMLRDFLHHAWEVACGYAVQSCRHAYLHIHTFLSLIFMRLNISCTDLTVGGLSLPSASSRRWRVKVVSASINLSSIAAPCLVGRICVSGSFGCTSSSVPWWSFLLESLRWMLCSPSACAKPSNCWHDEQHFHPLIIWFMHVEYVCKTGVIGALLMYLLLCPLPWHTCRKLSYDGIVEPCGPQIFRELVLIVLQQQFLFHQL